MTKVYLSYNNIISSLGFDSKMVGNAVINEQSGIDLIEDVSRFQQPFYGSLIDSEKLDTFLKPLNLKGQFTPLEQRMILSLDAVIKSSNISLTERVGLIISTTKGNIDVLESNSPFPKQRAYLYELANVIKQHFGFVSEPIVVSNACVSGLLAISVAKRYIEQGLYDSLFIVSGDLISEFVVSGFNSFQALSNVPCQPFSMHRSGINLGEVAASIFVTANKSNLAAESVELLGDSTCNDANHISGPSRTGEGLYKSIKNAMKEADLKNEELDFISAHGTATLFNDEMEAVAFDRLGLNAVPVNSLKGYFGHTLGASGLLETIIGMHSMHRNTLIASAGFDTLGVSKPINIIKKPTGKNLNIFLKTASGFGGCNTAAIFKKLKS